jgi:prepilin-type N-terminal cleavage/methylation domain-containing protein
MKKFKIIVNSNGLTLIEVLIALVILTLAAIGAASIQTNFGGMTADRETHQYIYNIADNILSQCRAGVTTITPPSDVTCVVNPSPTACQPPAGSCSNVSVTVTKNSDSVTLPSSGAATLCNF